MDLGSKMERFNETVLREASIKRNNIENKIKNEFHERIAKIEMDALDKAYRTIQAEKVKAARLRSGRISARMADGKREVLALRKEIIDSLFERVAERLAVFRKTQEYASWLRRHIQNAKIICGDSPITVSLIEGDEQLIPQMEDLGVSEWSTLPGKTLGGCRVACDDRRILIDETFADRMEGAYKDFRGIRIEE